DPFPWQSFAVWILTQMKRWGQIGGEVDYPAIARQVFLSTDTAKLMQEMGLASPANPSKSFSVMGREFDPTQPDAYVKSFAIKRSAWAGVLPMHHPLGLRAGLTSLALLGLGLCLWHLGTAGTRPAVPMDPAYAKLVGAAATQGASAMPGPAEVAAQL